VFVVIEFLTSKEAIKATEDDWIMALDAAGDGLWDLYLPDGRLDFSEKWYKVFGHKNGSIDHINKWMELIHPEDMADVQHNNNEYFAGKGRYFHAEYRMLCGDGSYRWVLSRGVIVARSTDGQPVRFTGILTDIDNRKKTEARYFATAQLLSKLINNLHDGILVNDEHKKIVYTNQMFLDLFQSKELQDELVGKGIEESMHVRKVLFADPETAYNRTVSIFAKQEIVLNEEWLMADGRTLAMDFIPLQLGKDNKGGIWKFRDITSQKTVEKQLADLRHFYENILNYIAADIVVFDAQERYLFINHCAIKNDDLRKWMIGKTNEDYCRIRNKSFDLVERRRQVFESARDSRQPVEWEEMLVNRDGITEHHLRFMFPIFDDQGNHLYGVGYGLNITDRVKARQELKTSMDTFASAFNDSGIGMALVSPEGKWIDVNHVLCQMTGYTKDELLLITFVEITHPDDLETDSAQMNAMLAREINTYSIEKRYISKNHLIIQVLLTVSLVWNDDNTPKFFIAQVEDITDKKKMEREILNKTAALEATKENLLNKINQLEDLSHIVAHNLRGPAGNIKMLSEALLAQNRPEDNTPNSLGDVFTQDEALILIHDSSLSLIDSLATLMQITEIKLNKEIARDDCDVAAILNDICNQLQSTIFEKQAVIRRDLAVPLISYPKVYFENILYNLISNSLKYARRGVPPEIDISTCMNGDRIQIIVKDNGLGIDLDKYADRVFRLNETFHQGYESKGVGLYITKTQVESFGGTIALKSKPEEGCEFIVTL
jgi:PAS domain S-box-containing protein